MACHCLSALKLKVSSNRFLPRNAMQCISAAYARGRVFHLQSFSLNWGTFASDRFSRNRHSAVIAIKKKTRAAAVGKKCDASTKQSNNFGVSRPRFKLSTPGSTSQTNISKRNVVTFTKIAIFDCFIAETIQDRAVIAMEC